MAIFPGDLGGIGIGAESAYGTGVNVDAWLQARPGSNLGKQQGTDEADALTVTKLRTRTRGKWAAGSFSFIPNYLSNAGLDALLEHIFGSVTGTTENTYAIKDPSDQASLSIWKDLGGRVERFLGCKVTAFEIAIAQGFTQMSVDVVAQDVDHPAPTTISHLDSAFLVHSNDLSVFTIDGTDFSGAVRELRIRMEIPHTGEERLFLGAQTIAEPQRSGPRAVSINAQIELADASPDVTALTDEWEGNTNMGDAVVTLASGTRSMGFTVNDITPVGDPITLDPGPAVFNLNGQAEGMSMVHDFTA